MRTFPRNDKQQYVERMAAHVAAGRLVQGDGWNGVCGCVIGCLFDDYDHDNFPNRLGAPRWLGELVDAIHEGLAPHDAQWFALAFIAALPENIDLDSVHLWNRLAVARIDRTPCADRPEIQAIRALHERTIAGEGVPNSEWDAAWSAAANAEAWDENEFLSWALRSAWVASPAMSAWSVADADTNDSHWRAEANAILRCL